MHKEALHKGKEAQWETWEDRTIDGTLIPLGHLRSFDMEVVKEARGDWPELRLTVRVVFDCHVVTEEVEENIAADPRYWLDLGGVSRRFHLGRYQYSFRLPDMISGLPTGQVKCYLAKRNNYMIWEVGDESADEHYQVYFDLYKPEIQPPDTVPLLILYVQSAYLKNEPFAAQRDRFKAFGQMCGQLAGVVQPKTKGPKSKISEKKKAKNKQK
jgi:hypothetical protein